VNESLGIPPDYAARRGFKVQAEATELVSIGENSEGREVRLAPEAARAWEAMKEGAFEAGVTLLPISGFRSVARQEEIIRAKLASGQGIDEILRVVAAPGYSEHHTGLAIDIGAPGEPPLTEAFAETPAFSWLEEHAPDYGFTLSFPRDNAFGIAYEPWHWRYHAPDLAL
jgi:zinc D-Ala-D-Ala carboxypeptidase